MLRVGMKLRLHFNQLPLKKQKQSFYVLLINKNTAYILGYFWQKTVYLFDFHRHVCEGNIFQNWMTKLDSKL